MGSCRAGQVSSRLFANPPTNYPPGPHSQLPNQKRINIRPSSICSVIGLRWPWPAGCATLFRALCEKGWVTGPLGNGATVPLSLCNLTLKRSALCRACSWTGYTTVFRAPSVCSGLLLGTTTHHHLPAAGKLKGQRPTAKGQRP